MSYVYIVQNNGLCKIGMTDNVKKRLKQFRIGNPTEFTVIALYEHDNPLILEQALHHKFYKKNMNGEWFNLESGDIEQIDKICEVLDARKVDANPFNGIRKRIKLTSDNIAGLYNFFDGIESVFIASHVGEGTSLQTKFNDAVYKDIIFKDGSSFLVIKLKYDIIATEGMYWIQPPKEG